MIIGVDVDGVLTEQVPHLFRWLKEQYNVSLVLRKRDVRLWNQPIDSIGLEQYMDKALSDRYFILTMPLVRGAKQALRNLSTAHRITIVTSRPTETDVHTILWLKKKGIPFHEFRNARAAGKGQLAVDILIDDRLENIADFAHTGKVGVLFSQPWNRDHHTIVELLQRRLVIRAKGWKQVAAVIESYSY